jgi:hypothetical protein
MGLKKNLSDEESRAFWASVSAVADEVRRWPAWLRGESERERTRPESARTARMLDALIEVELSLPALLRDEECWNLSPIFDLPRVDHARARFGPRCVHLYRVHPSDRARICVRARPLATSVLAGPCEVAIGRAAPYYELGVGRGADRGPELARLVVPSGGRYEIAEPGAWYSVRALRVPSLAVTVTAAGDEEPDGSRASDPRAEEARASLLAQFRALVA